MKEGTWLKDAKKNGLIISEGPTQPDAEPDELIEAAFDRDEGGIWWTIPLKTASETNMRDWRKRSKRTDAAWSAVSKAIGPKMAYLAWYSCEYHAGRPVFVRFVRLGGRRLDNGNVPAALKATEDATAWYIAADDGDERWRARYEQLPGGPVGVRVEFRVNERFPVITVDTGTPRE